MIEEDFERQRLHRLEHGDLLAVDPPVRPRFGQRHGRVVVPVGPARPDERRDRVALALPLLPGHRREAVTERDGVLFGSGYPVALLHEHLADRVRVGDDKVRVQQPDAGGAADGVPGRRADVDRITHPTERVPYDRAPGGSGGVSADTLD